MAVVGHEIVDDSPCGPSSESRRHRAARMVAVYRLRMRPIDFAGRPRKVLSRSSPLIEQLPSMYEDERVHTARAAMEPR